MRVAISGGTRDTLIPTLYSSLTALSTLPNCRFLKSVSCFSARFFNYSAYSGFTFSSSERSFKECAWANSG